DLTRDIVFHFDQTLPFHPNALSFTIWLTGSTQPLTEIFYSVGGGFVVQEDDTTNEQSVTLPYPSDDAEDVRAHCKANGLSIWQMVWENERAWRSEGEIRSGLMSIWQAMVECIYRGCHTPGELPGGLKVTRRAA